MEQETKWRQRENALKVQIAQLEATLKSDLGEKGSVIDRYAQERGQYLLSAEDSYKAYINSLVTDTFSSCYSHRTEFFWPFKKKRKKKFSSNHFKNLDTLNLF